MFPTGLFFYLRTRVRESEPDFVLQSAGLRRVGSFSQKTFFDLPVTGWPPPTRMRYWRLCPWSAGYPISVNSESTPP